MPDLRQTRKSLKTVLAVMLAADLLLAIVYFSPLVGSAETRRQEMNRLQNELNLKTRQVAPLQDLPQKVILANTQITDFYKKRFPSQQSQIATEFGKVAQADGVTIEQGKYKVKRSGPRRIATGGTRIRRGRQLHVAGKIYQRDRARRNVFHHQQRDPRRRAAGPGETERET